MDSTVHVQPINMRTFHFTERYNPVTQLGVNELSDWTDVRENCINRF